MHIEVVPFTPEWLPAVRSFNQRLAAHQSEFLHRWNRTISSGLQFPEVAESPWLPKRPERTVYEQFMIAVEGDDVRGGYVIKHQPYFVGGAVRKCGFLRVPISEGIVNPAYMTVALILMQDILQRYPLVFCLGMGGLRQPLPQWLRSLNWPMAIVPLYFKVLRPYRFLRMLRYLRRKPWLALLADIAACSGVGYAAIRLAQMRPRLPAVEVRLTDVEVVQAFDGGADELWDSCAGSYAMVGLRTHDTLNTLYPAAATNFCRLYVRSHGLLRGWAVTVIRQDADNPFFGNLRVGIIADCLAAPADAKVVLAHATRFLQSAGPDLIVSHQAHETWGSALRELGYLPGPSILDLALSPELARLMQPFDSRIRQAHLTRGDGEGPTNLIPAEAKP